LSDGKSPTSGLLRWLWFVGLWAAGVGVTGLVSFIIRLWLT
jgi:hypothetical protein